MLSVWHITQEHHKDGSLHLHCLLHFTKQIHSRDCRYLDTVYEDKTYHASIEPTKSVRRWHKYIKKEDTSPLTNLEIKDDDKDVEHEIMLKDVANLKVSGIDTMHTIRLKDTNMFIRSFQNIRSLADWKDELAMAPEPFVAYDVNEYIVPDIVQVWRRQIGKHQPRCRLLIICGPPMVGKTEMIRSFGPHVYIRGMWNLEDFNVPRDQWLYTVFDDYDWGEEKGLLRKRPILLGMRGRVSVTDKYKHKMSIDAGGRPCVIITNLQEDVMLFTSHLNYKGLVDVVYVRNRLYTGQAHTTESDNSERNGV